MSRTLPRVLVAWEMGANYGHAVEVSQLASELAERTQLTLAVREPDLVRSLLGATRADVLAAPQTPFRELPVAEGPALSYPDVLRQVGWGDVQSLTRMALEWRSVLAQVRPDVLVTQAAPTALLAAYRTGIPRVVMGGGYDAPPRTCPMPPFIFWEPVDQERLIARETVVTGIANSALAAIDGPELSQFSSLLDVETYALTTLPEIDHYGPREDFEVEYPPYLGLILDRRFGTDAVWPTGDWKAFAYLRPNSPTFEAAVKTLADLPDNGAAILAAPGASDSLCKEYSDTRLNIVPGPVKFDALLDECDLGVSHGSTAMASVFASRGIRQLCLPDHTEQLMVTHAVWRHQLGIGLAKDAPASRMRQLIEVLRDSSEIGYASERVQMRIEETDGVSPSRKVASMVLKAACSAG